VEKQQSDRIPMNLIVKCKHSHVPAEHLHPEIMGKVLQGAASKQVK
jgi:hypothetical protein